MPRQYSKPPKHHEKSDSRSQLPRLIYGSLYSGLCVSLVGSAILGLWGKPVPGMATPAIVAQVNPNPSIFNEPPFNRTPRSPQPAAPAPTTESEPLTPDVTMTPVNGKVNIHFVNQTGAEINYQVIGETQFRKLAGRSEMTLRDLPLPTTFTFRRQDDGLLQVTLQPDTPAPGTLTMLVRETTDFSIDRTSLYVDKNGGVFLN